VVIVVAMLSAFALMAVTFPIGGVLLGYGAWFGFLVGVVLYLAFAFAGCALFLFHRPEPEDDA
jgi:hypothetical protein